MIIKIANLSEGVHTYNFNNSVSEIGLSEPFFGNFEFDAEIVKSNHQIILNAQINLRAHFCCDRCTLDFDSDIHNEYQMVYLFGKEPVASDEYNIKYLSLDADKIELSPDLRDYALLAVPMKQLCKEDCKGLCTSCGKDLNYGECGCADKEIDARWLPLQELKNKLHNN